MTVIEEAIQTVADALKIGVCEDMITLSLLIDGYTETRIATVIRWAKQLNKGKS